MRVVQVVTGRATGVLATESSCNGRSGGDDGVGAELAQTGGRGQRARAGVVISAVAGAEPRLPGDESGEPGDRARPILRVSEAVRATTCLAPPCRSATGRSGRHPRRPPREPQWCPGQRLPGRVPRRSLRVTSFGSAAGSAVVTASAGAFAEIAPGLWGGGALARGARPFAAPRRATCRLSSKGRRAPARSGGRGAAPLEWPDRVRRRSQLRGASRRGLAEGELFGYRRGAFTGADRASPGFFRSAEGGTLLLDEVSDLPLGLQAKLLRVLEQREVQPLGETRPVPIDVRVVVAGQHSLIESVRAGRFRPDFARAPRRPDGSPSAAARASRRCPSAVHSPARRHRSRARSRLRQRGRGTAVPVRLAVQRARGGAAREAAVDAARQRIDADRRAPAGAHRRGRQPNDAAARAATPGAGAVAATPAPPAARGSPSSCPRSSSPCAPREATWPARRRCGASAASAPIA